MKTAVLIDTGANVLSIRNGNIFFVPISIILNDKNNEKSLKDVIEVSQEELKNMMLNKVNLKTSLPSPGLVIAKLEELYKTYDRVILMTLSSGISSFFDSLNVVKKEFDESKLVCIDSRSVSEGIIWMANDLVDFLKTDPTNQAIVDFITKKSQTIKGGVIVNDLEQLIKGGRISKVKGLVAKMIRLKLIIRWDGDLVYVDKSTNLDVAIDKLLEIINEKNQWKTKGIKRIAILTDLINETQKESLKNIISTKVNHKEIIDSYLPGCIYAHVGVNNFAILIEANE